MEAARFNSKEPDPDSIYNYEWETSVLSVLLLSGVSGQRCKNEGILWHSPNEGNTQ